MKLKGLYAIVDNSLIPEKDPVDLALSLLKGGARVLQLRMKRERGFAESDLLPVARRIRELKGRYDFSFIINDYLEIAKRVDADGFHGGKDDVGTLEARRLLGTSKLIGYSSHSLGEALEAERRGADYVAFGAIYRSPSKGPGHPVQGIGKLKEVVEALRIPVVAIGGIGRENIKEVLGTGVQSVAMISSLVQADDICEETEFYTRLLEGEG